jgi:hypothetical protein
MNDLAELALDGLLAARRAIVARPAPALAAAGAVCAGTVVVLGARIGAAPAAVPIDRWLGLLPEAGYRVTDVGLGLGQLAAITALLLTWLLTCQVARRDALTVRQLSAVAVAWAVPFAVGPPLLSTDVFIYAARGLLSRAGQNPYLDAPSHLGALRVVDAIDPVWRGAESSDGPLATLLSHLVVTVSAGSAITAVLVFRALAIVAVVVIGRCSAELAGPSAPTALCLTVLNPAVLLFVLSASLWAGWLCALLLLALVAARRRHWTNAAVILALAAALKPVALVAIPVLLVHRVLGQPLRRTVRVLLPDLAAALAALAAITMAVPPAAGWLGNFGDAFREHLAYSPSTMLGTAIGWVVPAAYDDLQTGARLATATAGVMVILGLLVTRSSRSLEGTMGLALLTAAAAAPVLYPQFLLWGIVCLATALPQASGAVRGWVLALSCAACTLNPAGLGERGGQVASFAAVGALAAVAAGWRLRQRGSARARHDPGAARRHRRHIPGAWPLLAARRRDVDPPHDDLQHGLRLHHRQGGA